MTYGWLHYKWDTDENSKGGSHQERDTDRQTDMSTGIHHQQALKESLVREIGLFIGMKSTKLAADEKNQHQAYESCGYSKKQQNNYRVLNVPCDEAGQTITLKSRGGSEPNQTKSLQSIPTGAAPVYDTLHRNLPQFSVYGRLDR